MTHVDAGRAGKDDGMSGSDTAAQQETGGRSQLVQWGIFAAILVVGVGYVVIAESDILWSGFIAMLIFYAIFYYLGSSVGGKRGSASLAGMMVAGRGLPLWIGILTMTATWVGGGYISGSAESTFASGLVWAQAPWGYALSLLVGGVFFAPIMRRGEFMTMLDPIDLRAGRRVAGLSAIPAMLAEIFWTAAILVALGTTFGTILGLSFTASILISAAIAIAYTTVGGMWSVALTDVVQVVVIIIGLFLIQPVSGGTSWAKPSMSVW